MKHEVKASKTITVNLNGVVDDILGIQKFSADNQGPVQSGFHESIRAMIGFRFLDLTLAGVIHLGRIADALERIADAPESGRNAEGQANG